MIVMGDFEVGDVLYFFFDAYDANGASVTITGLAVTDLECYKAGSVTQRASDNGYALLDTDGIDFDGVTGLHGFSIDTGDNSDAGFWAAGSQYLVNVNAVTIATQTVRFSYQFTLGRLLKPATAGRKVVIDSAGLADSTVVKLGPSGSGTAQTARDIGASVLLSAGTGTGQLDFTSGVVKSNLTQMGGVAQSATDLKDFADDGYDPATNKVQGVVLVDTLTTYTGDTPQTGDAYAIVNSGTHGNAALKTLIDTVDDYLDTEIAAIKAKTDQLTFTTANKVDATLQAAGDLATAVAQKIGDITLRRTTANAEASSNGDTLDGESLLGALEKLVSKVDQTTNPGFITVFRADGTTQFYTQAIVTDGTAEPITEIGEAN